jgi:putative ABC transport system permease protein
MLELKNIKKSYKTGEFVQHALKGVSLTFDRNEFVCILGASGSGKTTLLNIIGGLDRYDSGDLIINNMSTKKFNDSLWDAYRNNCVGFIFQSYNLIGHLSVLENVEMSLTLSGVKNKKDKALSALDRVGLKDHAYKKPNQLSGGQMQRVAIARAIVNDPEVILADEPTGALDTKTSKQIMELIKEISKEKLVIMVTHNPDLAKKYATRIIEVKDGEVISDSLPKEKYKDKNNIEIKKTKMSFLTALKLSFNNIRTKKGRTFLTAFASSIGIIGISIILSLSNGFDKQVDIYQKNTLSNFPITISKSTMSMDEKQMEEMMGSMMPGEGDYPKDKVIYSFDINSYNMLHTNNITKEYIEYIEKLDDSLISGISFTRATNLNLLVKNGEDVKSVSTSELNMGVIPKELDKEDFMMEAFDLLDGEYPKDITDIVLVVDSKNRVDTKILKALGLSDKEKIDFKEVLGKEIKLVFNNQYYTKYMNMFIPNSNLDDVYYNKENLTLKVVGIVRNKEDNYLGQIATSMNSLGNITDTSSMMSSNNIGSILYKNDLVEKVISVNSSSDIVLSQSKSDNSVFTGEKLDSDSKDNMLLYLGSKDEPFMINIYPKDFESKDKIIEYLDKYNIDINDEDKIVYNDLASTFISFGSKIMDAITVVLIAFSAVSLVVSSIMIGIITYISVLERTKEIGVLRSLGARKKDVSRVFNAETFIVGVLSGLIGVLIARLLIIPVNIILKDLTGLSNVAILDPLHALLLIVISTTLTLIGGAIPANMASKKDPVIALRTE